MTGVESHHSDPSNKTPDDWQKRNQSIYWDHFWRSCGISTRHAEVVKQSIDRRNGELDEAISACITFCRCRPLLGGLYLFGAYGTGKTLMASKCLHLVASDVFAQFSQSEIAWDNENEPPHCEIVSVPALLARIRGTYQGDTESTSSVVDGYRFRGLLVLDDIGREKPSDWVRDTLFQIIDSRYGQDLPTIFTSNYHLSQLEERLGLAIVDRILEMCQDDICEIRVGSYRGGA